MSAQPRLESKPFSAPVDPLAAARVAPLSGAQVRGPQRPSVQSSAPPIVIENKGNDRLATIRQNFINAGVSDRADRNDAQKMARQEGQNVRKDYRDEDIGIHRANRDEDANIRTEQRGVKTKIGDEDRKAKRDKDIAEAKTVAEKEILEFEQKIAEEVATTQWNREGKPLMEIRKEQGKAAKAKVGLDATRLRAELKAAMTAGAQRVLNFENAKTLSASINKQRKLMEMSNWESAWAKLLPEDQQKILQDVAARNDAYSSEGLDKGNFLDTVTADHLLAAKQRAWDSADSYTKTEAANSHDALNKLLLTAETKLVALETMSPDDYDGYKKALKALDQSLIPLQEAGNNAYLKIIQGGVNAAAPKFTPGQTPTTPPTSSPTDGDAIRGDSGSSMTSPTWDDGRPSANVDGTYGPTSGTTGGAPSNANLLNNIIDPATSVDATTTSTNPKALAVNADGEVIPEVTNFDNIRHGSPEEAAQAQRVINAKDADRFSYLGDKAPSLEGTIIAGGANDIAQQVRQMAERGLRPVMNAAGNGVEWVKAKYDDASKKEVGIAAGIALLAGEKSGIVPKLLERPGQTEYDKAKGRVTGPGTPRTLAPAPTPVPQPTPGKPKTIPRVRVKAGDVIKPPQAQAHGLPPTQPVLATKKDVTAANTARDIKVDEAKTNQLTADNKKLNDWKRGSKLGTPEHIKYQKGIDSYSKIEAFAKKHGIKAPSNFEQWGRADRYNWYRKEIDSKVIPRRIAALPEALKKKLAPIGGKAVTGTAKGAKLLNPFGKGGSLARKTGRATGLLAGGILTWDIATILGRENLSGEERQAAEDLLELQEMTAERAIVENAMRIRGIVDEMLDDGMSIKDIRSGLPDFQGPTDEEKNHAYEYLDSIQSAEDTGGRADSFNAPLPDVPISDANDTGAGAARIKPPSGALADSSGQFPSLQHQRSDAPTPEKDKLFNVEFDDQGQTIGNWEDGNIPDGGYLDYIYPGASKVKAYEISQNDFLIQGNGSYGTIDKIAKQHGITLDRLLQGNPGLGEVLQDTGLSVGDEIIVPSEPGAWDE
jgi:hypothetical protein